MSIVNSFQDTVGRMRATGDIKETGRYGRTDRASRSKMTGLRKACDNCIYFLARREWCDLPELNIPVDPDWYCDLWRV